MNYWKSLSLILVLSTGMAYGMDREKQEAREYLKDVIIKVDPEAEEFNEDFMESLLDVLVDAFQPKNLNETYIDNIRFAEFDKKNPFKNIYERYRNFLMSKQEKRARKEENFINLLERTREALNKLNRIFELSESEYQKVIIEEREAREKEREALGEKKGVSGISKEEKEILAAKIKRGRKRKIEERRLVELEELLEFQKSENRKLKAKKDSATRRIRELVKQQRELRNEGILSGRKYETLEQDYFKANKELNEAIRAAKKIQAERDGLTKNVKQLREELENAQEAFKEKEELYNEQVRALKILREKNRTPEELKQEEVLRKLEEAQQEVELAGEARAQAEGEAEGNFNALARISTTKKTFENEAIQNYYNKIFSGYVAIKKILELANDKVLTSGNDVEEVKKALDKILADSNFDVAYNTLFEGLKGFSDERWNYKTNDIKVLLQLLEGFKRNLTELVKNPMPETDKEKEDKEGIKKFDEINKYYQKKFSKLAPIVPGFGFWTAGNYLYSIISTINEKLQ